MNKTNDELDKLRKELASMKEKLNRILEDQKKESKNDVQKGKEGDGSGSGSQDLNKAELN